MEAGSVSLIFSLDGPVSHDFLLGGTIVTTAEELLMASNRSVVRRLISLRQPELSFQVGFIVLDDSLQNNVLLPFLWHSQGCTLDFFLDVLSREGTGMERYSLVIPLSILKC
jgi:hypothetical protein